jgi:hypothetical protein
MATSDSKITKQYVTKTRMLAEQGLTLSQRWHAKIVEHCARAILGEHDETTPKTAPPSEQYRAACLRAWEPLTMGYVKLAAAMDRTEGMEKHANGDQAIGRVFIQLDYETPSDASGRSSAAVWEEAQSIHSQQPPRSDVVGGDGRRENSGRARKGRRKGDASEGV